MRALAESMDLIFREFNDMIVLLGSGSSQWEVRSSWKKKVLVVARIEYEGMSCLVPVLFLSHSLLPGHNEVNMSP